MSLVCHRCVIGTVLLYLSPCFYPVDFVNCWEQPDITPEAEIPAGVISHTSQNLMKKNMGTETKGPSPSFPAGVISQTSPNKEKHGDGNKRTVPMFFHVFLYTHFCSRGVSPPFASTVRRLVARDIAV